MYISIICKVLSLHVFYLFFGGVLSWRPTTYCTTIPGSTIFSILCIRVRHGLGTEGQQFHAFLLMIGSDFPGIDEGMLYCGYDVENHGDSVSYCSEYNKHPDRLEYLSYEDYI